MLLLLSVYCVSGLPEKLLAIVKALVVDDLRALELSMNTGLGEMDLSMEHPKNLTEIDCP